jgi:hypothetical protein
MMHKLLGTLIAVCKIKMAVRLLVVLLKFLTDFGAN